MKTASSVKSHRVVYRHKPGDPLTESQKANIEELLAKPEHAIDMSDIPELPTSAWRDAVRGRFYRPVKQAVSLRLDADVLDWLKRKGPGYQTRVNRLLRNQMLLEHQPIESAALEPSTIENSTDISDFALGQSQLITDACFAELRHEPGMLTAACIFSDELFSGSIFSMATQ
jgi:uncharacterized protein (DUF4415 family)